MQIPLSALYVSSASQAQPQSFEQDLHDQGVYTQHSHIPFPLFIFPALQPCSPGLKENAQAKGDVGGGEGGGGGGGEGGGEGAIKEQSCPIHPVLQVQLKYSFVV